MKVAGIDYSSKAVDIVLVDDDTGHAEWERIKLAGPTTLDRARSLRGRLPLTSWWEDHGVYLVGIEDPIGRHAHTAKALGHAGGAIAALLPAGLTLVQTTVGEWKTLTTGAPSATKHEVTAWARRELQHGISVQWAEDAYDAYAIARAVHALNDAALRRQEGAAA